MNILMMTNTYLPHVGGVANSVSAFTRELRQRGYHVVVAAPTYDEGEDDDPEVIRLPAIQHFNGSDFSVVLPIPGFLDRHLEDFRPEIVHSHHPFLVGSTAVRISSKYTIPLVYTHHTMFEQYTHYVPVEVPRMKEFVVRLSVGYANLADMVIAPSESVAEVLQSREAQTPIEVIPTGIDIDPYQKKNPLKTRKRWHIPEDAFLVGHIGRLAPEKNLDFLARAVAGFLQKEPEAHFLAVGYGPSADAIKEVFSSQGLGDRLHLPGKLTGRDLIEAYQCLDVFAFSSKSETQGLVLTEAMAAGVPVVALEAPGVREVVQDGVNGWLVLNEHEQEFTEALCLCRRRTAKQRSMMRDAARQTAEQFSIARCTDRLLDVYRRLKRRNLPEEDISVWEQTLLHLKTEWELFTNLTSAIGESIHQNTSQK